MPSAGFDLTIPSIERPKTYALDRTASGRIEPDPRSVQLIAMPITLSGPDLRFTNIKICNVYTTDSGRSTAHLFKVRVPFSNASASTSTTSVLSIRHYHWQLPHRQMRG